MRNLSGNQIREEFLRFFEGKGHRRVHSSSLVPANDPTLLFTNAGMNQFKDVFLGAEVRDYKRAVSSQKCVRAGGKHNDLENVGFTRRHHTFFEMLGNFSFGDYFKRDAIAFAWELLTSEEWFGIDKSKLYVTIFEGDGAVPRDDEAFAYWREVGVPAERIVAMGPPRTTSGRWAIPGRVGRARRFITTWVWRLRRPVKMWRFPGTTRGTWRFGTWCSCSSTGSSDGVLSPLPKPSIDTGMGLERIACVLQEKLSNYESDLFTPLLAAAARLTGFGGKPGSENPDPGHPDLSRIEELALSDEKGAASLRIIADHARASTFLISDGVQPANEGRGYVLRKILRRGIRHGRLLGQEKPFMHEMVLAVRDEMSAAYPELKESAERVAKVVLAEELQFARVMDAGAKRLQSVIDSKDPNKVLPDSTLLQSFEEGGSETKEEFLDRWRGESLHGREAFTLYETYGLPLDFMVDAARDAGIPFDMAGFESAKEEEQQRRAGLVEGWIAEVGFAGVSRVGEDGV